MAKTIPPSKEIDYTSICFVVMPFSKKMVEGREIDFDYIYDTVFEPAIAAVDLPEGGKLIPKRTDKDYFAANIDVEMFKYLEYSRFALVDITDLNANVFYELGIRHHANQSGTAIFRQEKLTPPFDISHIKAFPYEYEPMDHVTESRTLITKVLTDSLAYNRIDSPVQMALQAQQKVASQAQQKGTRDAETLLLDATNAFRNGDWVTAIDKYTQAIQVDKSNPLLHQELGLLLKNQGKWTTAVTHFEQATRLSPAYSEAWRELGIAQNKAYMNATKGLSTGEDELLKAIGLNGEDFDAYASLGGIYKRQRSYDKSLKMYSQSVKVSNGHPYPLLNAILLQIRELGTDSISTQQKLFMRRAEISLRRQVKSDPPYNPPWSFFDLSTICLLTGRMEEAVKTLSDGLPYAPDDWYIQSHLETLMLVEGRKEELPGWEEITALLKGLLPV